MDDLISRAAAIEEIARRDSAYGTVKVYSGREINAMWGDLPAVDAIPVEWLKHRLTMALKNGCDAPEQAIRYVLWLWEQQKDGEQEAQDG